MLNDIYFQLFLNRSINLLLNYIFIYKSVSVIKRLLKSLHKTTWMSHFWFQSVFVIYFSPPPLFLFKISFEFARHCGVKRCSSSLLQQLSSAWHQRFINVYYHRAGGSLQGCIDLEGFFQGHLCPPLKLLSATDLGRRSHYIYFLELIQRDFCCCCFFFLSADMPLTSLFLKYFSFSILALFFFFIVWLCAKILQPM